MSIGSKAADNELDTLLVLLAVVVKISMKERVIEYCM